MFLRKKNCSLSEYDFRNYFTTVYCIFIYILIYHNFLSCYWSSHHLTQNNGKESENSYRKLKSSQWTGARTHTRKQTWNVSADTTVLLNQKRANVCEHTMRMTSLELLNGATRGLQEEWMEENLKGDYLSLMPGLCLEDRMTQCLLLLYTECSYFSVCLLSSLFSCKYCLSFLNLFRVISCLGKWEKQKSAILPFRWA